MTMIEGMELSKQLLYLRRRAVRVMLACSLFDIASLRMTDKILADMDMEQFASNLDRATIHRHSDGSWNTLHTRWNMELLNYLFNENDRGTLLKRKKYLNNTLRSIYSFHNEKIAVSD